MLERIKQNESLCPYYEAMYNQCLVLLVSYSGSAVRELFIDAAAAAIEAGTRSDLLDAELRITPRLLRESPTDTPHILAGARALGADERTVAVGLGSV